MIYGRKGNHAFCWGWSYETQSWTKLLGDKLCIFRWDLYLKFTACWLFFVAQWITSGTTVVMIIPTKNIIIWWCSCSIGIFQFIKKIWKQLNCFLRKTIKPSHILAAWSHVMWWNCDDFQAIKGGPPSWMQWTPLLHCPRALEVERNVTNHITQGFPLEFRDFRVGIPRGADSMNVEILNCQNDHTPSGEPHFVRAVYLSTRLWTR